MEDYIEYLVMIKRYDDAAQRLVEIINDERFVSTKGKSKHEVLICIHIHPLHCSPSIQLWVELCEIIRKNATEIRTINVSRGFLLTLFPMSTHASMQVDAILRSGIRKFTDMVGKLWNSLADFYIRRANFDKVHNYS